MLEPANDVSKDTSLSGRGYRLFALGVKVDAANFTLDLVEADVVEALEAGTCYGADSMIGDQEVFLPPHKDGFPLSGITNHDGTLSSLLLEWAEGGELGPVAQVNLAVCTPVFMLGVKAVFGPNDLAFKVCRESWVVLS